MNGIVFQEMFIANKIRQRFLRTETQSIDFSVATSNRLARKISVVVVKVRT